MEEGKLFLSVTVSTTATRDISSISLIVDDRLWFYSVIQTGDLPSFLQIQIPMSSMLAQKNRVRLLFMYFFHSIPKSVLIGGFSLGVDNLLLAFTPMSGSGLKPTILFEHHGSCLCSSKTKQFISNKCIILTTRRCGGGLNAR